MFDIVCMTDSKSDFAEQVLAQDALRRATGGRRNAPKLNDDDIKTVRRFGCHLSINLAN